jgi:hypothetical protein
MLRQWVLATGQPESQPRQIVQAPTFVCGLSVFDLTASKA